MPYILYKRDNGINDDPHSFNSIMLRKLNDDITDENMIDPNDTPSSLLPKLNDMVQAMVMAEPTLTEEHALFHILHSPHGRKLAEHLNNLTKKDPPMIDLHKLIPITEDALMSTVVKRDGERFDTAFARRTTSISVAIGKPSLMSSIHWPCPAPLRAWRA
jgi:hypothetical protein